jgi:protein Mpv17
VNNKAAQSADVVVRTETETLYIMAHRIQQLFQTRPLLANFFTASALMAAGDAIAQKVVPDATKPADNDEMDWKRLTRMTIAGACTAPIAVLWFRRLEMLVPGRSVRAVATKVAINATLFAPLNLSVVLGVPALLQQKSPEEVAYVLRNKLPELWINGSFYWPFVHAALMSVVPLPLRPLLMNAAGLGWNVYVCFKAAAVVPLPQAGAVQFAVEE